MAFKKLRRYCAGLLLPLILVAGLLPPAASASFNARDAARIRVLFIGNSYTYFNNLPRLLTGLAASANQVIETEMIASGGATLKKHWDDGRALEALKQGRWDYVILQEQSTLGPVSPGSGQINSPKMFHEYARLFNTEIVKAGAKTLFFLTWARQNLPQTQAQLAEAYLNIAKELKAMVAPVGLAWQKALKRNPSLALHQKDLSHPTPAGSYLTACVLFTTLCGKSSVGLTARIVGDAVDANGRIVPGRVSGGNGQSADELVNLSKADAAFLQQVARETTASK